MLLHILYAANTIFWIDKKVDVSLDLMNILKLILRIWRQSVSNCRHHLQQFLSPQYVSKCRDFWLHVWQTLLVVRPMGAQEFRRWPMSDKDEFLLIFALAAESRAHWCNRVLFSAFRFEWEWRGITGWFFGFRSIWVWLWNNRRFITIVQFSLHGLFHVWDHKTNHKTCCWKHNSFCAFRYQKGTESDLNLLFHCLVNN